MSADWIWHGTAGHFIMADRCCFRLHTQIGNYRVSTVGCCHSKPGDPAMEIGSGRTHETMVFELGDDGEPDSWGEIDSDVYNDNASAERGHIAMCVKIASLAASKKATT